MKKLLTLIVVALFTTATFAQDSKTEKKATATPTKYKHECYMMKDDVLMHCMGEKAEVQKTNVTLKDGTTISTKGEIKVKDRTAKLGNGNCIDLNGAMGDCEKMHASLPKPAPKPVAPATEEVK